MSPREHIDRVLADSRRPRFEVLEEANWIDVPQDFATSHFLNGFGHADGKFHFKADWKKASSVISTMGALGPWDEMPVWPDHWDVTDPVSEDYPFRLTTSPARTFLNSTFNETPGSRKREGRPTVLVHPQDMARLALADGARVALGSRRGQVVLHAKAHEGQQPGVLVAEGLWPNADHEGGAGINTLTGADQPAPAGGGSFHDISVWIKAA
jgi:anaerobic selenocysteine-containing dehydrogenase